MASKITVDCPCGNVYEKKIKDINTHEEGGNVYLLKCPFCGLISTLSIMISSGNIYKLLEE